MATRGKISELYDIEKIKAQQAEVIGYVDDFVKKVSNTKPIRLNLEGAEKTGEVIKWVTALGAATKENVKIVNQATVAQAKYNALQTEAAKELASSKVQIQQRNKELAIEAQLQNASANSLEYANAMVKKLTAERNKLDLTTQEGITRQAELNAELDKYNKFITENSDKQEKQRRNIGNYGSSLKTLEAYLADVRQQLASTQKAASGLTISAPGPAVRGNNSSPLRAADNSRQVIAYTKSVEQATDRVAELTKQEQLLRRIVESQIAGYASATAEIKNNEKALQALAAAGLQNTEFYKVLLKDTAELKDSVGDLKDEIKALASDTRQIDLVASAVTGLVNVFQVGASAAEVFAGSNEEIQKSIQRLVALQNISQGIQQIANDLTTRGTALNKIYNFIIGEGAAAKSANTAATTANTVATIANAEAQEVAATATTGLTVATKVLRGALIASGIGLLIAGIIYLVTKIQEWQQADLNLIKHQAELNQVTLETIRLNKELADLTRTDIGTDIQALKNKVAAAQAYGKSQGEVLAAEKALLKARQEAATYKFFDNDGAGKLAQLETQLRDATAALVSFNEEQAVKPIDDKGNAEQVNAQRALLQSNVDLLKEKYSEQRVIVDDYYNYNNEVIAKQLQIDRLNADERRKYALETATISANTIIDANQRALENDAATLKQRLALMQSTTEQQKKIARAQNEDVQNDPGASANDKLLAARNLAYQLSKIEKDSQEAQRQLREEYRKRDLAAELEMVKIRLEAQVAVNDRIAQDETKSFNERTDALYAALEKRRAILVAQYEIEIADRSKTDKELQLITEKYLADVNQLTIQYGIDQLALYKNNGDLVEEELARQLQKRLDTLTIAADNELLELNEARRKGLVDLETYEQKRAEIEARYRLQSIQKEINDLTYKVLKTKEGTAAREAAERALKDKTLEYSDEINRQIDTKEQLRFEKTKSRVEAIGQLYQNLYSAIGETLSIFNDKESASNEKKLADIDTQTQKEIDAVNATVTNKEEKEAKINEINQKAAAQKALLDQKQRQLDLEKARFDKASNITNIITGTALAVINTLKDPKLIALGLNIPLAATIGVLGGVQLARAIAAPLPKYADGTEDHPGGLSRVGDGGKKELVIEPSGKTYKTPATSTIMDIPKHSVILPDADAVMRDLELVAMNNISKALNYPITEQAYGKMMTKAIENKLDRLTNVVSNKHELHIKPGFNSIMALHRYGSRWNKRINEQTKF